ncbi:MAG: DISARM system helicase DrmA [Isosphaerales bacterium]
MKSVDARAKLVQALRLDLVGPENGSELEAEILNQAPSRWYLTGFLVPLEATEAQRVDETADDDMDGAADEAGGTDDAAEPEKPAARRALLPSSLGLSLLVTPGTKELKVLVRWGDYSQDPAGGATEAIAAEEPGQSSPAIPVPARGPVNWKRTPREKLVAVNLPASSTPPKVISVPNSGDSRYALELSVLIRPVQAIGIAQGMVPPGTRSVSIFLVNHRRPAPDELRDTRFAFQAQLEVQTQEPLIARPNVRGRDDADWDERVGDLQYRDVYEYAVGHGVATHSHLTADAACHIVRTCWLPDGQVEFVAPSDIQGVILEMEALATLTDADQARERLLPFVRQYREWIERQQSLVPSDHSARREVADELLHRAEHAATRIENGITLLSDAQVLDAFRTANKVMARAARQRFAVLQNKKPAEVDAPRWRPFQLAYLLMNLPGIVNPLDADRQVVDLLFFPTGGGKTEAYLGLAAFTLVYRRLKNPGILSAGLSVLMRYTLRLLTLDQLGRAATLICALELERENDPDKLGPWPFEIGLWVGRAATPNRMGRKGDNDPYSARLKTISFQNDDRKPSPIPLETCPWCGTKFKKTSFSLWRNGKLNSDEPDELRVVCANRDCEFTRNRPLPIQAVDEPVYRRLPCFMIATVDKFAAMPWTGQVGAFFGRVQRHDENGFYGPCDLGIGRVLSAPLPPPDLIIQDELHLISGPMGTMVGLYESALDALCTREIGGKTVGPKIIASTATVRRAEKQILSLFNRRIVDVFPPPGPNRRDSFFAETHTPEQTNPRLYVGVAAQGRSLKVVMLRTYLALLAAAQKAYDADGGKKNAENAADPYMSLLGYFNSLRELGGSRRIVEDEVTIRLIDYSRRKRMNQAEGPFANRTIDYDVVELTSRESTNKVADAKRRLALRVHENEHVDVAIATNMISVGLDIPRLGLMVVLGQPKTCAEYIQATSRVGRDPKRPGLVVTLLNVHRPRDRSHYERFEVFHQAFYRAVEATSVTPFSPRALDRGLAGTLVALARQKGEGMTPPKGASEILTRRQSLEWVANELADRASQAAAHVQDDPAAKEALRVRVRARAEDLLDSWEQIAHDYQQKAVALQYNRSEAGAAQPLLRDILDPDLPNLPRVHWKFRANRSMRDVEPSVNVLMRNLDRPDDDVALPEESS